MNQPTGRHKHLLAVLSPYYHDALGVASRLEGGQESLSCRCRSHQGRLAVLSDHLPHQWFPQGLGGATKHMENLTNYTKLYD